MTTSPTANEAESRDLVLERVLDAPRSAVWRCWTEPALVTRWFTPPPWETPRAELDVRPGGSIAIVMRGPDGEEVLNRGVFLEVVPERKLVSTDAFVSAWVPSEKPFMTLTLTFADEGAGRTRYLARAAHWSVEAREQHEQMGFHQGWGIATDQLEALARRIADNGRP